MIIKDKRLFYIFRPGRIRQQILPLLVWMAAVAGVAMLFYNGSQRVEVVGMAQAQVYTISANCPGRLKSLNTQLFEKVVKDQNLADVDTILDNENIQAELAVVAAQIEQLRAELAATQNQLVAQAANLENDKVAAQRRFSVDVENSRLRILELKTTLETDRLALENLQVDEKAFLAMGQFEANDTAYYELQKIRGQHDVIAKRIQENELFLAQAAQDLAQAQLRRDEFAKRQPEHPSVDQALDVIRKAIKVQEQQVEQLLAKSVPIVLKSPVDGVVSFVGARPGEAVLAGTAILTVAEEQPQEIIAYANENSAGQIRPGTKVQLIKGTLPMQIASSEVFYIGPVVEQLPLRLWPNPNTPQWGRPFLVKVPEGMRLRVGELISIRYM
jgi:multidrug resistance efflux pump